MEVLQFDLVDKMRQELLRPLSGIRAELTLPAIITNIERDRIERVAAALATDPALPADLEMFLRWFSRTQKLFTLEKALEESPINWWSYNAWGAASPDRLEILPVKTVTLSQNKWCGSQEIVTVDTIIPVIEQPIPVAAITAAVERGEDEGDDEDEEPEVVYAEGTIGDMFKVYDLQPPKGGTYKPEEYYVDKPVFEPLAKPKVKEEHMELFNRVMHSKIKDPSAMDWTVNDPSVDSPEKGEHESEFAYRMKLYAQQLNHSLVAAKFGLEPQVWGDPKERKPGKQAIGLYSTPPN